MKQEAPNTESQSSISDEATIKDGMKVGIIITAVNFTLLGALLLSLQYGADFTVPDMVLYNHTGGEIEIHLGREVTVDQKDSSGRVDQPETRYDWTGIRGNRRYKPFSVGTVNK